jgi:WhiB family redox-sensing transcriptional regulator
MSRNDQGSPDFGRQAAELDHLAHVPIELLVEVVDRGGTCWWEVMTADPPDVGDAVMPDRALAARMCAGCPVQRECLELELRTDGAETAGVWGGLCEVDRRALHKAWLARRTRAAHRGDRDGGERG